MLISKAMLRLALCPIDSMEPVEVLNRVEMEADLCNKSGSSKKRGISKAVMQTTNSVA